MPSVFEQIVAEIHAQLADADLPYGVLRGSQDEHGDARRVVWIPLTFQTSGPQVTGPIKDSDGQRRSLMYSETWLVEAHIVGTDLADTEDIRARLLYATRKVMHTAARPVGGVWVTQAIDGSSLTYGGLEKVVQRFEMTLPVYAPLRAGSHAKIKHIVTTPTTVFAEPKTTVVGDDVVVLDGQQVVVTREQVDTAFSMDAPETD